jgi:hypothetical protein
MSLSKVQKRVRGTFLIDFSFRMINFLMMKLSVLFWIFTLGGVMVFGQERVIDDIKFNNEPNLYKVSQNHFRLSYPVKRSGHLKFQVKIQDFDTLLNLIDTSSIQVRGRFELMASGRSQTATFNLLGDMEAQSLLLFRTDHKPLQTTTILVHPNSKKWSGMMSPFVTANKDSKNVVISFWNKEINKCELIFFENGERQTWAKIIALEEGFIPRETFLAQNYLFLVLAKGMETRKTSTKISVWNLTSGREQYVIALDKEMRKKTLDNILYVDSTHVLLTGKILFDKKINKTHAGIPYLDELSITSGEVTSFPFRPDHPDQKFFWTSIHNFNGVPYLFGEDVSSNTFKLEDIHNSVAVNLLIPRPRAPAIPVTLTSTVFLQDIIILNLTDEDSQIATIPAQAKSITIPGNLPAFYFTRYAYEDGLTHFMGLTDDNRGFYFENGGETIRFDMIDGSTRSLGFVKVKPYWKILDVNDTNVIVADKKSDLNLVIKRLEFETKEENGYTRKK